MTRTRRSKQEVLAFPNGRGGARRGAGRKRIAERARVSHKKRDEFEKRLPVHVTLRLAERLPTLRRGPTHYVLRQVLVAGAEREGFRLVHYSAMGNHIHLVCEADDWRKLARGIQGLCVRIARTLNQWWERRGKVFADRFHSHALRSPTEVHHALGYVLRNAHHHKLVLEDELDPFSSAAWFDGWSCGNARTAVARLPLAQTWVMNVGWKRLGLLDPEEDPDPARPRKRA